MAFINIIPPVNKIKNQYDLVRLIKTNKIDITIKYDQISYDEYYTTTTINKNYIIIKKVASAYNKLYLEMKLNNVTRECSYPMTDNEYLMSRTLAQPMYGVDMYTKLDCISNSKDYIGNVLYTFIDIFTPELDMLSNLKFDFDNENLMNEIFEIHAKFYDKYNQIQGENILCIL